MKSAGTELQAGVRSAGRARVFVTRPENRHVGVGGRGARGRALRSSFFSATVSTRSTNFLALLARSSSRAARSASASWGWAGSGVGGLGSAAVNARREARGKKRQVARSGRETRLEASVDGRAMVLHNLGLHERGGVVHVRDSGVVRGGDGGLARQRRRREELLASGFLGGAGRDVSDGQRTLSAGSAGASRARDARARSNTPLQRA